MLRGGDGGIASLSALLCQFAPQLLINKNCCLNVKLPQFLHVLAAASPAVTGPSFCREMDKRHEVYGKKICGFIQIPLCNATRESHA